jgi:hypothetical protein
MLLRTHFAKGGYYDSKYHFLMFDRLCAYFCGSKHTGGGISVSGLDPFDVQVVNALWDAGDWRCCRLAIEGAQTKSGATRFKQKEKIDPSTKRMPPSRCQSSFKPESSVLIAGDMDTIFQ